MLQQITAIVEVGGSDLSLRWQEGDHWAILPYLNDICGRSLVRFAW